MSFLNNMNYGGYSPQPVFQPSNFGFSTPQASGMVQNGVTPSFLANTSGFTAGNLNLSQQPVTGGFSNLNAGNLPVQGSQPAVNTSFLGDMSFSDTVGLGLGAIQTFLGYQNAQDQIDVMKGNLGVAEGNLELKRDMYQNRLDAGRASVAASKKNAAGG